MIRLFVAIAIPAEIGEGLARRQQGVPGARWRTAEQLHLTLRFAGEIAETVAEDWDAELARLRGEPFDLALAGVGAFGEGASISTLWAGVEKEGERDPAPAGRPLRGRRPPGGRRAGTARVQAARHRRLPAAR